MGVLLAIILFDIKYKDIFVEKYIRRIVLEIQNSI